VIVINIGITFFWGKTYNHIWSNGAGQNMYFLKQCLEQIDGVESVYFVYWRNDKNTLSDNMKLDLMDIELYEADEVVEKTDILIEGTLTLEPEIEQKYREHGAKIVSYRMGNDFIGDMEKMVHHLPGARAFNGTKYDAVWMIPQHMNTNRCYLEIMTKAPVYEVPHLWSPIFLEEMASQVKEPFAFGYEQGQIEKNGARVSVLEPNISVLKNCMIPILIGEEAYRNHPELIKHIYLCNTFDIKDDAAIFNYIGYTAAVKSNVMSVETRHITPLFLAEYTDIVVSFQWENALNYVYYETLYGKYPLVHNSPMLKDKHVGFYYDGFDAYDGERQLINAIKTYDTDFESHQAWNQKLFDEVSPNNPENIRKYQILIEKLGV
jgi:hypothetical protein